MNIHTQFYRGTPPPVIRQEDCSNPGTIFGWREGTGRAIYVNNVLLDEAQARSMDGALRSTTPDGSYWYDRLCGAWGCVGGPCRGLMPAGLNLGGPLRADASHGNSRVFINGRELHFFDVMALQQITVVLPGRYWLDAYGNFGFEGHPALGNLWAVASQPAGHCGGGGRRESVLSTWDRTGVSVYSL